MNKWAIIGMGFIGPRHIQSIEKTGGKVVTTCDIDPSKGANKESFEELLNSEEFNDVENVAICTPNHLHVPMALECLKKGKRVLSEKPLGISSGEISKLPNDGSVFSVLQLRHHPEVKRLSREIDKNKNHDVLMRIIVSRDNSYWEGWKGDTSKSGGILMNIGIHYFDLLLHLFGLEYEIEEASHTHDKAKGVIKFPSADVTYDLGIIKEKDGQDRVLSIDGEPVSLSKQDNLSFEDLHTHVYNDFLDGRGILPKEAMLSVKLVEELKRLSSKNVE